jgi:Mg/Co/Ni transporter MgtE
MDETGWLAPHFDSGCIECNDLESAVAYLRNLHPADSAALLAELEPDQQAAVIERLHTDELAEGL